MNNLKALQAWESVKQEYDWMQQRTSWVTLYPGWETTVKSYFLMGYVAGLNNDTQLRNKQLMGCPGDIYRMTTEPFIRGFSEGYLAILPCTRRWQKLFN